MSSPWYQTRAMAKELLKASERQIATNEEIKKKYDQYLQSIDQTDAKPVSLVSPFDWILASALTHVSLMQ